MKFVIEYKGLYISNCCIDGYDSELNIYFTSQLSEAKKYNEEDINTIKNILLLYFSDIKILACKNEEE